MHRITFVGTSDCFCSGALLNDDACLTIVGYNEEQLLILAVSKRVDHAPQIPAKRAQINAASDGRPAAVSTAAHAAAVIATPAVSASSLSASAHNEVAVLTGHTEEITSLSFDHSGRYIASGSVSRDVV